MDVRAAAQAIKDQVDPDFAVKAARDQLVLGAVLRELKLADTPENRFQAAAALYANGIETRDEYPKMLYRARHEDDGGGFETLTVVNEDYAKTAKANGWTEVPGKPEAPKPDPAPQPEVLTAPEPQDADGPAVEVDKGVGEEIA